MYIRWKMWVDKRKQKTFPLRLNEYEDWLIENLAEIFSTSKAEAVRRAIWSVRILFEPTLNLEDLVREKDWTKPLADLLKPFPELSKIISLEYSLWKKYHKEDVWENDENNKETRK